MLVWLAILAAGGLGGVCRYLLGQCALRYWHKWENAPFLTPMLLVNLLGSWGLGLSSGAASIFPEAFLAALTVGFWGAFTTFSTFSLEAITLLRGRLYLQVAIYLGLTVLGSLGAYAWGHGCSETWWGGVTG